jgi:hypothetical protein
MHYSLYDFCAGSTSFTMHFHVRDLVDTESVEESDPQNAVYAVIAGALDYCTFQATDNALYCFLL